MSIDPRTAPRLPRQGTTSARLVVEPAFPVNDQVVLDSQVQYLQRQYGAEADRLGVSDLIRRWRSQPPHDVLETGSSEVLVPFLTCGAAEVAGAAVTATHTGVRGAAAELSFTIAGTGPGATGKLSLTTTEKLTCAAGNGATAFVHVPIYWERRSPRHNADISWLHVEPLTTALNDEEISVLAIDAGAITVSSTRVNNSGSQAQLQIERSHSVDRGLSFAVGLSNDLIEASVTVTAESSDTVSMSATLPGGRDYAVRWMGGPPGVRLEPR